MNRRRLLEAGGAAALAALAGCTGILGSASDTASSTSAPPTVRWRATLDAEAFRVQFALGDEYAYYALGADLHAVALSDGFDLGGVDVSDFGVFGVETLADSVLVWVAEGVAAYDPVPGSEPRWRQDGVQRGFVVPGRGVVATDGETFRVIDVADGSVRWRRAAPVDGASLVAWSDGTLVATGRDGDAVALWGLAWDDGRTRWTERLPDDLNTYVPTLGKGARVYRGSNGYGPGRVLALDAADGRRLWETSIGDGAVYPLGVLGDAVLVEQDDAERPLRALGAADGEPRWSLRARPVDLPDDWLLARDAAARFAAVEPDGRVRWRVRVDPADDRRIRQRSAAFGAETVLSEGRRFVGVDPASGDRRWQYDHVRRVERWWHVGDGLLVWDGETLAMVGQP